MKQAYSIRTATALWAIWVDFFLILMRYRQIKSTQIVQSAVVERAPCDDTKFFKLYFSKLSNVSATHVHIGREYDVVVV